jgi:hypothetical protein
VRIGWDGDGGDAVGDSFERSERVRGSSEGDWYLEVQRHSDCQWRVGIGSTFEPIFGGGIFPDFQGNGDWRFLPLKIPSAPGTRHPTGPGPGHV